ncbi:transposase [Granulicella tundricola]|uniref:Transposase IS3/IS911 family protein n=1 Tax=Granulicella tundricola (strain ATCC BAA-1859 / DSM 23138 / MP5ACTX9) TaxID=1198114 RepID=E8X4Z9_GRATM|nr:transposase [Granulicella tundricola]ADW67191.1 transposase IS3/IS911 family protein [Granulicella tundricola MP5ACTX9]
MSGARVARKYGINANQVFQWRRLQQDGLLGPAAEDSAKLLPVSMIEERRLAKPETLAVPACGGKIHIELPGRVSIRLEGNVDAATARLILKSLRP